MGFGLSNACQTFQCLMNTVLRHALNHHVLCYLDDVLVFSGSFDKHLQHLQEVFDKFREANLRLNPRKCHWALQQVRFLGHTLSANGVAVDMAKVEKVKAYPQPQNASISR